MSSHDNLIKKRQKKKFFKICKCEKEFNTSSGYYKHLKKCLIGKSEVPTGNYICLEEDCSFRAKFSEHFLQHLKEIHNEMPIEDVKIFQNYSDFKRWLENFEKEERCSFIRRNIHSYNSKKVEYYSCNRGGKYLSKSSGERRIKKQGSRKIGFNCPACVRAIMETGSSLVTVHIKTLHYGHSADLCHINLQKSEKMEIANQLIQGVSPKQVLENLLDVSTEKLERKHLLTKQDLKNIRRSIIMDDVEKHDEDGLSVDLYVEEVTTDEMPTNDEVKDEIIFKMSQIQKLTETCSNQDLLLATRQHINNALDVLKNSQLNTENIVNDLSLKPSNLQAIKIFKNKDLFQ